MVLNSQGSSELPALSCPLTHASYNGFTAHENSFVWKQVHWPEEFSTYFILLANLPIGIEQNRLITSKSKFINTQNILTNNTSPDTCYQLSQYMDVQYIVQLLDMYTKSNELMHV